MGRKLDPMKKYGTLGMGVYGPRGALGPVWGPFLFGAHLGPIWALFGPQLAYFRPILAHGPGPWPILAYFGLFWLILAYFGSWMSSQVDLAP